MAFDFTDFVKATLPAVGAASGAGLSGRLGTTTEAGLLGGLAVGQFGSSALGLLQDIPDQTGATGDQNAILAQQLTALERAGEQRGLSAQSIQAVNVARQSSKEAQLQQSNLLGQQLSPLEAEAITRGLAERQLQERANLETRVASLDEAAQARRITDISNISMAAAKQADVVRLADEQAKNRALQLEIQKQKNFAIGLSSVATGLQGAMKLDAVSRPATTDQALAGEGDSTFGETPSLDLNLTKPKVTAPEGNAFDAIVTPVFADIDFNKTVQDIFTDTLTPDLSLDVEFDIPKISKLNDLESLNSFLT